MLRRAASSGLIALASLVLVGCGGEALGDDGPPGTIELGELSDPFAPDPTASATTVVPSTVVASTAAASTTTAASSAPTTTVDPDAPIGRLAAGNRVLVIGDSILAAISDRYGDELCDQLVPAGWSVEVDAESGRSAEFGLEVLDDRLAAGWDAAVVMLGNNYRDSAVQFDEQMAEILDRLGSRPIVLLTVTEFETSRAEVNYVLEGLAASRPNVWLGPWRTVSAGNDALLGGDGLHLSTAGRAALAGLIAEGLGAAPAGSVGSCLDSDYEDDSQGPPTIYVPEPDDPYVPPVDDDDDGPTQPPPPATTTTVPTATTTTAPRPGTDPPSAPRTDPPAATDPPAVTAPPSVPGT